jgi:NAD(P) transhydrogenase subunit alpha
VNNSVNVSEPLIVGVPREIVPGERRVALVPDVVAKLVSSGLQVLIEAGAGCEAFFPDEAYREAGGIIALSAEALYQQADIVLKVQPPAWNKMLDQHEADLLRPDSVLITFLEPQRHAELLERLAKRGVMVISMNAIPRITRAQPMDALSSMSTIAGYKAVLLAANALGRFFPMLMTAAGTLAPARVLVLGAGVAGLQALATARRLGAVTQAFDTRPAVKEQVQSVGATFIELPISLEETEDEGGYARAMSEEFYQREQDAIREHVARADVVITTALIPGKPAPRLITKEMVQTMQPGSVIVDLAAEQGGNCALTVAGETVVHYGVTILGPLNLPSTMPIHASQMYARNIASVVMHIVKNGRLNLDFEDEIIRSACLTHDGRVSV